MAKSAQLVFVIAGDSQAKEEVEQYLVPSMARKVRPEVMMTPLSKS
jgi:hypothetical protein